MPARDATLFVTWRDTMSCLLQLGLSAGQRVAVFGSGGNGLSFTRFATLRGAKVVMVGSPARSGKALRLGAAAAIDYRAGEQIPLQVKEAFGGAGADLVIEAVGSGRDLPRMLKCLAVRGRLFLFGIPGDLQFPANLYDGPSEYGVVKKTADEFQSHAQVLADYQSGGIKAEDFCDGELPLDEINRGFDAIRRKEAIKLTVRLPH